MHSRSSMFHQDSILSSNVIYAFSRCYYKKEKQRSCKPGSVPVTGAYLQTGVCHLSSTDVTAGIYRSTLRLGRTALSPHHSRLEHCRYTRTFNIRCAQHVCRHTPGGLLPRLLTLTCIAGGIFLLHRPAITDSYPLGSGLSCVARTFLSPPPAGERPATDRTTVSLCANLRIFLKMTKAQQLKG